MKRQIFLSILTVTTFVLVTCNFLLGPPGSVVRADEISDLQKQLDQLHRDLNAKQGEKQVTQILTNISH